MKGSGFKTVVTVCLVILTLSAVIPQLAKLGNKKEPAETSEQAYVQVIEN